MRYCEISGQTYACREEQFSRLINAAIDSKSPNFKVDPEEWQMVKVPRSDIGINRCYNFTEFSSAEGESIRLGLNNPDQATVEQQRASQ